MNLITTAALDFDHDEYEDTLPPSSPPSPSHTSDTGPLDSTDLPLTPSILAHLPVTASSLARNGAHGLILLPVVINGILLRALVDSGCQRNLLGAHRVHTLGLPTIRKSAPETFAYADGSVKTSSLYLKDVTLDFGSYYDVCTLDVFDIQFDVILGKDWLSRQNPTIDWKTNTVLLGPAQVPVVGNDSPLATPSTAPQHPPSSTASGIPLISAISAAKALEEGDTFYVGWVKDGVTLPDQKEVANQPPERPKKPDVLHQVSHFFHETVLPRYTDVFPDELPAGLPPTRVGGDFRIQLEAGSRPVARPPFATSVTEREELKRQLEELLAKGFIRPSNSPFGAPVIFIRKPDQSLRLCVDYRGLNRITVKDKYPLPAISELLDTLLGSTCFSKLDLRSGYHQVKIAPEDTHKTAFVTRFGQYEFKILPFGLANAPSHFMRMMNEVFKDYKDQFVILYLDDLLIFSRNPQEHLQHVELVLQKLRENQLFAKREKCSFFQATVSFLGHQISAQAWEWTPLRSARSRSIQAPRRRRSS